MSPASFIAATFQAAQSKRIPTSVWQKICGQPTTTVADVSRADSRIWTAGLTLLLSQTIEGKPTFSKSQLNAAVHAIGLRQLPKKATTTESVTGSDVPAMVKGLVAYLTSSTTRKRQIVDILRNVESSRRAESVKKAQAKEREKSESEARRIELEQSLARSRPFQLQWSSTMPTAELSASSQIQAAAASDLIANPSSLTPFMPPRIDHGPSPSGHLEFVSPLPANPVAASILPDLPSIGTVPDEWQRIENKNIALGEMTWKFSSQVLSALAASQKAFTAEFSRLHHAMYDPFPVSAFILYQSITRHRKIECSPSFPL